MVDDTCPYPCWNTQTRKHTHDPKNNQSEAGLRTTTEHNSSGVIECMRHFLCLRLWPLKRMDSFGADDVFKETD